MRPPAQYGDADDGSGPIGSGASLPGGSALDARTARTLTPALYAIVVVAAFLLLSTTAAVVVAVVGAMLVGLTYTVTGRSVASSGRGRDRKRDRGRGR